MKKTAVVILVFVALAFVTDYAYFKYGKFMKDCDVLEYALNNLEIKLVRERLPLFEKEVQAKREEYLALIKEVRDAGPTKEGYEKLWETYYKIGELLYKMNEINSALSDEIDNLA